MAQSQEVTCSACSTTLRVPEKYWGKKVRCPQCKEVIAVPAGAAAPVAATKAPAAATTKAPAAAATDDVDFLDDDAFVDEDPYVDEPATTRSAPPRVGKSSKTSKSSKPDPKAKSGGGAFSMEKGMLNAGVLGGLGLMLGAVVWFVVGFLLGYIFYYPPIMFIIGFVALVKGLIGSR
jgi:ribosomal protein S27E